MKGTGCFGSIKVYGRGRVSRDRKGKVGEGQLRRRGRDGAAFYSRPYTRKLAWGTRRRRPGKNSAITPFAPSRPANWANRHAIRRHSVYFSHATLDQPRGNSTHAARRDRNNPPGTMGAGFARFRPHIRAYLEAMRVRCPRMPRPMPCGGAVVEGGERGVRKRKRGRGWREADVISDVHSTERVKKCT